MKLPSADAGVSPIEIPVCISTVAREGPTRRRGWGPRTVPGTMQVHVIRRNDSSDDPLTKFGVYRNGRFLRPLGLWRHMTVRYITCFPHPDVL